MVDLPEPGLADDRDGPPARDVERHVVDGEDVVGRSAATASQGEALADALEPHEGLDRGVRRPTPDLANGVEAGGGREQPSRVCVFGLGEDPRGGSGLDDLPLVHHGDGVSALGRQPEVVGDEQDAGPQLLGERVDGVEDAALHRDVERGGRLVGDEQPRTAGQADRDERALPHPAGELVRVLRGARRGVRDPDQVQQLERPGPGRLAVRDVVHLEGLGHLVADPHERVEVRHRVLGDQSDPRPPDAPHLALADCQQVPAVEQDAAGGHPAVGRQ